MKKNKAIENIFKWLFVPFVLVIFLIIITYCLFLYLLSLLKDGFFDAWDYVGDLIS